ncbi:hypothetical protein D3C78_1534590 [compost metagenome]
MVGGEEARVGEGIPGGLGFRDQLYALAVESRLLGVALVVVRGEVIGGDGARGAQGLVEHAAVVLGIARALQQRLGVEHFVELEFQFAFVEQQVSHGGSRLGRFW